MPTRHEHQSPIDGGSLRGNRQPPVILEAPGLTASRAPAICRDSRRRPSDSRPFGRMEWFVLTSSPIEGLNEHPGIEHGCVCRSAAEPTCTLGGVICRRSTTEGRDDARAATPCCGFRSHSRSRVLRVVDHVLVASVCQGIYTEPRAERHVLAGRGSESRFAGRSRGRGRLRWVLEWRVDAAASWMHICMHADDAHSS